MVFSWAITKIIIELLKAIICNVYLIIILKNKSIIFIDTFYFKAAPAGIKTYIKELVASSKKSNSTKYKYIYSHDIKKLENNVIYLNSKFRISRWLFQLNYFFWKQFILPVRVFLTRSDMLICTDYVLPCWTLTAKKMVVLHDTLFWKHPEYYSKLWRKYYLKSIKTGIDKNTLIVTTSEYAKYNLSKVLNKKNEIKVIYQSVSAKTIKKINSNRRILLHVGSFEKRKDLMTLVESFKLIKQNTDIKDLKLILAGETNFFGDDSEFRKVNNFIKQNDLVKDIQITGYLSNKEVKKLYSSAFLYIFPSTEEGFGIPILESFSFGVPVICSDLEVFNEIGRDAILTFKKRDSIDLSNKIEILLNSDEKRNALISNGFKRLNNFSRENFINSYEKYIDSIL